MNVILILLSCFSWAVVEVILETTKTSSNVQQRKNFESWVFNGVIVSALVMLLISSKPFQFFSPNVAGTIILIGLVIRLTAIRQLGRFFSVDLGIHGDHQLIQKGLYRFIRHPTYTGALISFFGLTLMFQNLVFNLVFIGVILIAYLWRIRIEEGMLLAKFEEQYIEYRKSTRAIIPWLI